MTNQQPMNYQLPTEQFSPTGKVAIYARVATPAKIATQPTQTNDLLPLALQLGWGNEQIILFDQDNGLPGDTNSERRKGFSTLTNAVVEDVIKAVLVNDESRLFRDTDTDQVNSFIRLCSEHDVVVITPQLVYDFRNPYLVKLFRFKCKTAYQVLEDMQNKG